MILTTSPILTHTPIHTQSVPFTLSDRESFCHLFTLPSKLLKIILYFSITILTFSLILTKSVSRCLINYLLLTISHACTLTLKRLFTFTFHFYIKFLHSFFISFTDSLHYLLLPYWQAVSFSLFIKITHTLTFFF